MKRCFYLIIFILSIFIFNDSIYAYKEYKIGDVIKYNDIEFYVIKDSSIKEDSVTLLKKEPLTVEDINTYAPNSGSQVFDVNGYGAQYFSDSGVDYENSNIKSVVDAWAADKFSIGLKEARLITIDELINNLYYEENQTCSAGRCNLINIKTDDTPSWVYNNHYSYWTMSPYQDSSSNVWCVDHNSRVVSHNISVTSSSGGPTVRPVIVIFKSAIEGTDEAIIDDEQPDEIIDDGISKQSTEINKNNTSNHVKVPNTLKTISGLFILIGLVLVCVGINLFIIVKSRGNK